MTDLSKWEKYYQDTPLDEIPWQATQADYLIKLIDEGKVSPGSTLDLGCGTGMKSIYLAQKGFDVVGVDISETAIKYAKENARKADVKIDFIVADATDLSFLGDRQFDFILDWANLHGIPGERREKYIDEITKHTNKGSKLLLRCFGRDVSQKEYLDFNLGKISRFSNSDIENLYAGSFRIIETNKSSPASKNPPSKWFDEYLMERY